MGTIHTQHPARPRGTAMIEFAFSLLLLIPLLLGTYAFGLNFIRSIQVTQLTRDAGHMYARNVDFSLTANQNFLRRLAAGLNLDAVIILSTIRMISDADCSGAGLSGSACTNRGQAVFANRIVVGSSALGSSYFGAPPTTDSRGNVSWTDQLRDSRTRANNFTSVMNLQPGEMAYVAETILPTPDVNFGLTSEVYSRSIF